MSEKFDKFLKQKHLLSLAVLHEGAPYACSCFYAYDENLKIFVVACDSDTTHIKALLANSSVSGTIALDTKIIGKIKGVQFRGTMRKANCDEGEIYFSKFPFAKALNPTLWTIEISWIKFTDNTLGFGKKIIWKRNLN